MAFCITSHRDIFVIYVFSTLKKMKYKWKKATNLKPRRHILNPQHNIFYNNASNTALPTHNAFIPKNAAFFYL